MSNTFLNRVAAERRVLKAVNSQFSGEEQLAGLSQAALFRWQSFVGQSRVADVIPLLTNLAEKCQRLSDRSNETFMPIEEEHAIEIEAELEALKLELSKCR